MKIKPIDTYNDEYGPDNPNSQPGPYWVTVVDGSRFIPLAGPFRTHPQALAQVEPCRNFAENNYSDVSFYGFGTARCEDLPIGRFNDTLGLDETHGIYDPKKGKNDA